MPVCDLMVVALRVLGIWLAVSTLEYAVWFVPNVIFLVGNSSPGTGTIVWPFLATPIGLMVKAALAAGLIMLAQPITLWFYPTAKDDDANELTFSGVGAGDLYRIACFAMGIYVLTVTIQTGALLLKNSMHSSIFLGDPQVVAGLVQLAVLFSLTGLLIFGSGSVARALGNITYDSEAVPNPQFTIRVILFLVLLTALLIGILRFLVN